MHKISKECFLDVLMSKRRLLDILCNMYVIWVLLIYNYFLSRNNYNPLILLLKHKIINTIIFIVLIIFNRTYQNVLL